MSEPTPLRPVPDPIAAEKRGPARPFVHAAIRDAIVRAELAPGAKLSENELADRFGVSRTPIREALGRLRDDRLVQVVPQSGTFVARISLQADLRRPVHPRVARVRGDPPGRRTRRPRGHRHARGKHPVPGTGHAAAATTTPGTCSTTPTTAPSATSPATRPSGPSPSGPSPTSTACAASASRLPDYLPEMVVEHRAIVAAVAAHDADGAEEALRHHLRMVLREIPRIREQHPDYFEEA